MNMQKKFGTFGGVFTPSVLTILGVIMYMRLGAVVGNSSSIFMFVAIILFAHVISITTGFSVSSIATDKKIKAGGIYYMLSRSLGFPIGGAIGITLFVATALSISLYLIGFAESVLPVVQDVFGIKEITVNHFRLVGSLALLLVLTVAYVSTSFAIKIQYIILVLIGLSLVSIFTGSSEGLKKGTDFISSPNFAVLFGIFFPAVTGFTAGVAMSGDLKNPSKSIPWGTMLAILTGLAVYLALAFFINSSIDGEILRTNNNALIQFGSIAFLVIAGVWGATLSSALGGILGGPRILQAMSLDAIAPKIFGVGHGVNNEPRNALILTFVISELGILIGELNVIAEIVAMFYMAAYLFINVSCFLEQWASPDFRPKLKIPLWVSLFGAITTFLLMVQLNLGATLLSVLIIIFIFFWLTRKELVLGTGDVWLSVWSNVVKIGLRNLHKKSAHKRNWQPNVLLFSGATKERPHLIEFSKSITGRTGMVSNFDLVEEKSAKTLFPKHHQIIADDGDIDDSIFHRRLYCQNIFKGIEMIANTYGFSGVDPNTVLMGWARNTQDPLWFAQMTQKLTLLDYNVLFLDYDKKRGFGNYKQIDIWWSAINSESDLSLQLSKLILHSAEWSNAKIRILVVNEINENQSLVEEIIAAKIEKLRLDISFDIINNEIEQKELYKLIQLYSDEADLIMMTLPEILSGNESSYVDTTNSLMDVMGTTLILKASSSFKSEDDQLSKLGEFYNQQIQKKEYVSYNDLQVKKTSVYELDKLFLSLEDQLNEASLDLTNRLYHSFSDNYLSFSDLLLSRVSQQLKADDQTKFYSDIAKHVEYFKDNRINKIQQALLQSFIDHIEILEKIIDDLPEKMEIPVFESQLEASKSDHYSIVKIKAKLRAKIKKDSGPVLNVSIKEIAAFHFRTLYLNNFHDLIKLLGVSGYLINEKLKDILNEPKIFSSKEDTKEVIQLTNKIEEALAVEQKKFLHQLFVTVNSFVNAIVDDCSNLDVANLVVNRQEDFYPGILNDIMGKIKNYPQVFAVNQGLVLNRLITFLDMKAFRFNLSPFLKTKEKLFVNSHFNQLLDFIADLTKNPPKSDLDKIEKAILQINELNLSFDIKDELYDLRTFVKNQIDFIDFDTQIMTTAGVGSFVQSQSKLPTIKLDLSTVVGNLFDNQVLHQVNQLFDKMKLDVLNELKVLENALELNKFTVLNQTDQKLIGDVQAKLLVALNDCQVNISTIKDRFIVRFDKIYSLIDQTFVEDVVIERAKNHHSSVAKDSSAGFWKLKLNQILSFVKLNYSRTDDFIIQVQDYLAIAKYFDKYKNVDTPISLLKKFSDQFSPKNDVVNQLPFYYQQLFTGKHKSPSSPLLNRQSEFNQLNNAFDNFTNGTPGVVTVSGEPLSGKTFLINNVLNCLSVKQKVVHVKHGGSPSKKLSSNVNQALVKALGGKKATNQELLSSLAEKTIVYIEDFELFWTRSKDGFSALDEWEGVFKNYAEKLFFIVEGNVHFFKLLGQVSTIDNWISTAIFLQPLSSGEIQKIIVDKHKISGIDFGWKSHLLSTAKKRHLNRLFSKLNKLSGGNIGWAIMNWMAAIQSVENDNVLISNFNQRYVPNVLSPEWDLILVQIVLHKSIHLKDLFDVFQDQKNELVNENVGALVRIGFVVSERGKLTINPFLQGYIIQYLYDKKVW